MVQWHEWLLEEQENLGLLSSFANIFPLFGYRVVGKTLRTVWCQRTQIENKINSTVLPGVISD